jgi:hypothetical protein
MASAWMAWLLFQACTALQAGPGAVGAALPDAPRSGIEAARPRSGAHLEAPPQARPRPSAPPSAPKRGAGAPSFPNAGSHAAAEILDLLERVTARRVRLEDPALAERQIELRTPLAGAEATEETLRLVLGSVGLALVAAQEESEAAGEGERSEAPGGAAVWRVRDLRAPAADDARGRSFSRVFEVRRGRYARACEVVEDYVEDANSKRPAGEAPSALVAAERSGKLIVRCPTLRGLRIVEELIRGVEEGPDPADEERRLHVYHARNLRAAELEAKLLEALDDDEEKAVHVVIPRRTNALWIRASAASWTKIEGLLQAADVQAPRNGRSTAPKPDADPAPARSAHAPSALPSGR